MGIPTELDPLTKGRVDQASLAASVAFLAGIWTYPPKAYTVIGIKSGDRWKDICISGDRARQIAQVLRDYPPRAWDIYFCPNAFGRPSRKTEYALPSAYAWCDIDDNEVSRYDPQPNVLWETSPGRHQGLWIWRREAPTKMAAQYSRNIVYKDGGDKNGWSITKMLRLPGTVNHKPRYAKPVVTLKAYDRRPQKLPKVLAAVRPEIEYDKTLSGLIDVTGIAPQDVIRLYRGKVNVFARTLMKARRVIYPDRSEAIFVIVSGLVSAGASDPEIASVLLINPHFVDKHGDDLAMAEREIVCIRAKTEAGR